MSSRKAYGQIRLSVYTSNQRGTTQISTYRYISCDTSSIIIAPPSRLSPPPPKIFRNNKEKTRERLLRKKCTTTSNNKQQQQQGQADINLQQDVFLFFVLLIGPTEHLLRIEKDKQYKEPQTSTESTVFNHDFLLVGLFRQFC
jgi:hypothetical protein